MKRPLHEAAQSRQARCVATGSRLRQLALLLSFTGLVAASHPALSAQVEKWLDASGRLHYGDRAPPEVEAVPLTIHPNLIETGGIETGVIETGVIETGAIQTGADPAAPAGDKRTAPPSSPQPSPPQTGSAQRSDLRAYIEQCRANRGIDCEQEARQMIDGPAPVIFPGDPAVFPRPDVKPPPPGLRLNYQIRP